MDGVMYGLSLYPERKDQHGSCKSTDASPTSNTGFQESVHLEPLDFHRAVRRAFASARDSAVLTHTGGYQLLPDNKLSGCSRCDFSVSAVCYESGGSDQPDRYGSESDQYLVALA